MILAWSYFPGSPHPRVWIGLNYNYNSYLIYGVRGYDEEGFSEWTWALQPQVRFTGWSRLLNAVWEKLRWQMHWEVRVSIYEGAILDHAVDSAWEERNRQGFLIILALFYVPITNMTDPINIKSHHAFLDNIVPKVEGLVLIVQLIIGNQSQSLIYLKPELFPVLLSIL